MKEITIAHVVTVATYYVVNAVNPSDAINRILKRGDPKAGGGGVVKKKRCKTVDWHVVKE